MQRGEIEIKPHDNYSNELARLVAQQCQSKVDYLDFLRASSSGSCTVTGGK